jgi:2-hydroxychromene-2-carboxylate isomerase
LIESPGVEFNKRKASISENRDISRDDVISDLCQKVDVDPAWLLASIAAQEVKVALRANVDEAIARGAFGSPTFYLDGGDMYFGVDRLQLMRISMERRRQASTPGAA